MFLYLVLSIEKRLSPIPDSTSLRNVSGFLLAIVRSIRAPSEKPIASTGGVLMELSTDS